MSELVDQKAREQIHTALDRTMVVEAAAGTGKTTALVSRIIALLERGARVDRIVAVTFTEKAAGELKLRIRAQLETARQEASTGSEARRFLEEALAHLEEARIGTIHGFCADLLRERSIEAEVDPRFDMLDEVGAERLFGEAFHGCLQEQLAALPEGLRRSLRRQARAPRRSARPQALADDAGPIERLRKAAWALAEWRDFPAPWRRDPFDREREIDRLVSGLHAFAELTRQCSYPGRDGLYAKTEAARKLSDAIRIAEEVRERDTDGLEAQLVALSANRDFLNPGRGRGKFYGEGVPRDEVLVAHSELVIALQAFARQADADLAALLQRELMGVVDRYEELKRRTGRVDFVDLLIRTRNLIRDSENVRREFQARFSHILIDEFQDTDPLQAEILLLLASDDPAVDDWRQATPAPGKLFLVADPKQSIYRFRRADVGVYLEVKELLEKRDALSIRLTTSFRAVPNIQRAVNAAFARVMTGDRQVLQADYVPLTPARHDVEEQPSVVALPVPSPYGKRGVARYAIDASLPDAVGAFVHWLIESSGWTVGIRDVTGDGERRVPIEGRHVCLLFRRFDSMWAGDVTRAYVEALESRGIRHLLVGGHSFHVREEVETIRTALAAIEWPDDELSVFASLRGSLFAIGDEELLEYRQSWKRLHPFRIPRAPLPESLRPITEALELLATLHRRRNHRPIPETISLLLEATRAHAGFVLRPSGEQSLANVLHFAEQARRYESAGGLSFRGFVEQLLADADEGKSTEAPVLEEGSDGVRLMTVHKAKGLEFPVVVLADITAAMTFPHATRVIAPERRRCAQRIGGWSPVELLEGQEIELRRDAAEGVRLAYVAATRARDLLVVPAVGDERVEKGWVSSLNHAIYPVAARWQDAMPAPGCPPFGTESAIRPDYAAFSVEGVRPGQHRLHEGRPELRVVELDEEGQPLVLDPTTGTVEAEEREDAADHGAAYNVVWWDPKVLELDAQRLYGVRRSDLISKDADEAVVQADVERYRAWESTRQEAVEQAARPSLRVRTATEVAADGAAATRDVEFVELPRSGRRPAGPRFGALVHAVLATVALDAGTSEIERSTQLQARILGATEEETDAAQRVVVAVLEHPLLRRARAAAARGLCRRETPVMLLDSEGVLIDGVVDLAFLEDEMWIVVEFKTDSEIGGDRRRYERQVDLYAEAIARASGRRTQPVLVKV